MAEIVNGPERNSGSGILKTPKVSSTNHANASGSNQNSGHTTGLKNSSNHHFGMSNSNNGSNNTQGSTTSGVISGHPTSLMSIDCHQNQNVPPPISPFPLSRIYSSHSTHQHHGYMSSPPSGLPH